MNSDTGIDSPLFPKTTALLSVWGRSSLFQDGRLIAQGVLTHLIVSQGARDDVTGELLKQVDPSDREVHLILPGAFVAGNPPIPNVPNGFLYMFWEDASFQNIDIETATPVRPKGKHPTTWARMKADR
ncbi:hypothetical protein HYR99_25130 [Candidatus Poribacteria bacterium]|nr:hypothetical protein [Candidatus Poribacteria bacterium]